MSPHARSKQRSFQFGEWMVEPHLGRLRRDQEVVHLEPRTLDVLCCLLDHPHEIVSHQELMVSVWNGRIVEPAAVSRNIAQIQRALHDDAHQPRYIETVPKRGYRTIASVEPQTMLTRTASTETPQEPVKTSVSKKLHNSIAVLPFDNLGPDPNNVYFAAGVHEEIPNQLAKIKDLSVIARTTMLRYADSDKSVSEIGDELNVRTVMEGSVRYAGNRVRITTQLVDTASGAQLWSEAYEENLEDIFGIQLAIAMSKVPNPQFQFWMHMAIQEYDVAMTYLERAIDENFPASIATHLHAWPNHPDYDPIRSNPMFDEPPGRLSKALPHHSLNNAQIE